MGSCLRVVAALLELSGALLALLAVATPHWALYDGASKAAGVLYSCQASSFFSLSQCQAHTAPSAAGLVLVVLVLAVLSVPCFLMAAGTALALLCEPSRCLKIAAVAAAFLAAMLEVAVLVLFAVRLTRFAPGAEVSALHASFGLAALGAGLTALGAGLLLCVRLPRGKVSPGSSQTFTRMTRSQEGQKAETLFVKMYSDFLHRHPGSLVAVTEASLDTSRTPAMHPPSRYLPARPRGAAPSPPARPQPRVTLDQWQALHRARTVLAEPIHQSEPSRQPRRRPVHSRDAEQASHWSASQHRRQQLGVPGAAGVGSRGAAGGGGGDYPPSLPGYPGVAAPGGTYSRGTASRIHPTPPVVSRPPVPLPMRSRPPVHPPVASNPPVHPPVASKPLVPRLQLPQSPS